MKNVGILIQKATNQSVKNAVFGVIWLAVIFIGLGAALVGFITLDSLSGADIAWSMVNAAKAFGGIAVAIVMAIIATKMYGR